MTEGEAGSEGGGGGSLAARAGRQGGGAGEDFFADVESRRTDLDHPRAVPDPHRAQGGPVDVKGDGPRGLRDEPVERRRTDVAEIPFRADARIGELRNE